ncbi:MAG: TetR/AcrR family transcriptional regulator [Pseudomonadota bacterium]
MDGKSGKDRYHHGDLREALIAAAHKLVIERGAENFTLADACRAAGVSTAAPYKHFSNRDEVLVAVVSRAFDVMAKLAVDAARSKGEGTLEGIVAMGCAYVAFARENPALFRLMFGQHPELKKQRDVIDEGHSCFETVTQQVQAYCSAHQIDADAKQIHMRLWTFVHGVASLQIDGDYDVIEPGFDYERMIAETTPHLLQP